MRQPKLADREAGRVLDAARFCVAESAGKGAGLRWRRGRGGGADPRGLALAVTIRKKAAGGDGVAACDEATGAGGEAPEAGDAGSGRPR